MQKIIESLKVPFKKNFFIGILDIIFRLGALILWLATLRVLAFFVWDAVFNEYVTSERMWWFAYSAMIFVMSSVLAYTAVYDRE